MLLVYRYEDPATGEGPYSDFDRELGRQLREAHDFGDPEHPGWLDEGYPRRRYMYSACLSVEALKTWFKGYNKSLVKEGYRIVCYSVPEGEVETLRSGKQCVFPKVAATKVWSAAK